MAEKQMSFFAHLEELRKRLIVCFVAVFLGAIICYFFWQPLLQILTRPITHTKLHYLSVLEPLLARFKIALFGGIILASPIIIYQLLSFVAPALKSKEKRFVYPLVLMVTLLFGSGVVFSYFFILPISTSWLLGQAEGKVVQTLTFNWYINYVTLFLLAFGVGFETPIVVWLLVKFKVVSYKTLRKNWRYVYVAILVAAAIITPDWSPLTMLLLAIPMILLYELSLFLSKVF